MICIQSRREYVECAAADRDMAAGLLAVAAAAVALAAAAALPVLADDKECFENCFKHCVGNDKSMTDYCNYACGMTCGPNDHALRRPLAGAAAIAGLPINCQLACVRESCHPLQAGKMICYRHVYKLQTLAESGLLG